MAFPTAAGTTPNEYFPSGTTPPASTYRWTESTTEAGFYSWKPVLASSGGGGSTSTEDKVILTTLVNQMALLEQRGKAGAGNTAFHVWEEVQIGKEGIGVLPQIAYGIFPSTATLLEREVLLSNPACIAKTDFRLTVQIDGWEYNLKPNYANKDLNAAWNVVGTSHNYWRVARPEAEFHHPPVAHLYLPDTRMRAAQHPLASNPANGVTLFRTLYGYTPSQYVADPYTNPAYEKINIPVG